MTISRVVLMQNHLGELGGVTTFCQRVAPGLVDRGYHVEIGATTPPADGKAVAFDPRVATWQLIDTPNKAAPAAGNGPRARRARANHLVDSQQRSATMLAAAESRFSEYGPETVVVFTQLYARERADVASLVQHWPKSYHTVGQYHSSFVAARDSVDLRRAKKGFLDLDKFLALTREDAMWFRKSGFNNTGFIHNPLEVPDQPPQARETRRVVALSRYDPKKGLDHVIRAWADLGPLTKDWQLDLYGEGPDRNRLEQLIASHGVEHNVQLAGFTDDVESVLCNAELNVLPSRTEGLPFSLIEASALGVPSIAYDCSPGIREIVDDGVTGSVVPVNDQDALRDAIERLLKDAGRRHEYAAAGHARMKALFDTPVILDQWQSLFVDLAR